MDFNSSFFENIIGIMIGSFISVITTMNYERNENILIIGNLSF